MAIIHQTGNCIKLAIVSSIYLCINIYLYIHFCVYIQQYSVLNFGRLLRAATQIPGQIFRWAYWKKLPKRMGSFEKSPNSQPRNQMPWTKRHSFNFQLLHSSWPKQFPPTKKLQYISKTPKIQGPSSPVPKKTNKNRGGLTHGFRVTPPLVARALPRSVAPPLVVRPHSHPPSPQVSEPSRKVDETNGFCTQRSKHLNVMSKKNDHLGDNYFWGISSAFERPSLQKVKNVKTKKAQSVFFLLN